MQSNFQFVKSRKVQKPQDEKKVARKERDKSKDKDRRTDKRSYLEI